MAFTGGAFASAITSSAEASHDPAPRLADAVARYKVEHGLRSVLFGVWVGEQKLLRRALGFSGSGEPVRLGMHFRAAVVTTTYVNALLLHLADRKRLDLDDKLSRWFPRLRSADKVTLRMLSLNTSGYPDYLASQAFLSGKRSVLLHHWTAQELIDLALSMPMQFEPGKSFGYSHTNAVILGEALQRATGTPIATLLQEAFLRPNRLYNTEYPSSIALRAPFLHAFSREFGRFEDSTMWDPAWVSHSGLMNSNLGDVARWIRLLGSGAVLSSKSQKLLTAPATVGLGKNAPDLYYAMGVIVANGWIMQNGLYFGWNPVMAYRPSKDITIVVNTTIGGQSDPDKSHGLQILKQSVDILTPDQRIPERYA
jgi:CubicO group peptidase (beta-lactamase class C family)